MHNILEINTIEFISSLSLFFFFWYRELSKLNIVLYEKGVPQICFPSFGKENININIYIGKTLVHSMYV